MLQSFLVHQRVIHSVVGVYSITVQPVSAKRAVDLWRMNTQEDYVRGEETLFGWTPRGISLIQDYIKSHKQKQRMVEVETARSVLSLQSLESPIREYRDMDAPYTDGQIALLQKYLKFWKKTPSIEASILTQTNIEPPRNGIERPSTSSSAVSKPHLIGTVRHIPKNPSLLKGGFLLCPDETQSRWVRRYVELRRPYLHIYTVPEGDELFAINLAHARIDHEPHVALLLQRPATAAVWAVFAPQNSFLFMGKSERDKIEWILKLDESYFSSSVSGSGTSSNAEAAD
jgi:kinesin family protein 1